MKAKQNILFPVEGINRELDFRLFLACMYAGRNNRIFIGQHNIIERLFQYMEGGFYLGKNIFREGIFPFVNPRNYIELKKRNFTLIHLDEEGIPFTSEFENIWYKQLNLQLNANYLAEEDYICTWGDYQRDFYRSRQPACKQNIRTTGHPRFDLYKPKYRTFFKDTADQHRQKYGEFVLINTNLQISNNGLGLADTFSDHYNYDPSDAQGRLDYISLWTYLNHILSNIIKLVTRLSVEFPSINFVVRPHPGEDGSFYRTVFRGVENVHVVHEGPVASWLQACRLLIHDGCTTGIEGVLGGTPVLNYKSNPSEKYDVFVPNNVGVKCFTEEEVIGHVKAVFSGNERDKYIEETAHKPIVAQMMANFKQDSFQCLLDVMTEAEDKVNRSRISPSWNKSKFQLKEMMNLAVNSAKDKVRPFYRSKYRAYLFYKAQFYGFNNEVVRSKFDLIQQITQKNIRWQMYNDSLIIVESD